MAKHTPIIEEEKCEGLTGDELQACLRRNLNDDGFLAMTKKATPSKTTVVQVDTETAIDQALELVSKGESCPIGEKQSLDELLIKCYKERVPIFISGAPGIGKSSTVRRVANQLGVKLIDIRLSQFDAVDLRGLPMVTNSRVTWAVPGFLPSDGQGILFLDELNMAVPSVQNAAQQLILDRKLGDYTLPDGWTCMAAGNRREDQALTQDIPKPLANRFVHLNYPTPVEDATQFSEWVKWGISCGQIDPRIIGFIHFKPDALFRFTEETQENAFPTPRSWEFCSKLIKTETNDERVKKFAEMAVGKYTAGEFLAFLKIYQEVDAKAILAAPFKYQFPTKPDELMAMLVATAMYAKKSDDTIKSNYIDLLTRKELPKDEYTVLGVQLAFDRSTLGKLLFNTKKSKPEILDLLVSRLRPFLEYDVEAKK